MKEGSRTNTMDICLNRICHLEINNQADILHVDTTTCEVGGNEYFGITVPERL